MLAPASRAGGWRVVVALALPLALAACAPLQPDQIGYAVGDMQLALPAGDWQDLGASEQSWPLLPELGATLPLQTRTFALRRGDAWQAVLWLQSTHHRSAPALDPTLWTDSCPRQPDVWVQDAADASPIRIDCLRFKRGANRSDYWMAQNHPALQQWLQAQQPGLPQPYAHISYRYATAGGAYWQVTALVDERLLLPNRGNNADYLRSGELGRAWAKQLRTAVRQAAARVDQRLVFPMFPVAITTD